MIRRGEALVCATSGTTIASRLYRADRWIHRLRGLIGYSALAPEEALWIEPCSQVHTHFMRYPLRVLFLDRNDVILREVGPLRPWRVSPWVRSARSVVELHVDNTVPLLVGQRLMPVSEVASLDEPDRRRR